MTLNPAGEVLDRLTEWLEDSQVDVDAIPFLCDPKRRKTESLSDIIKYGVARVTIKRVFLDRRMTFVSQKTGKLEMLLKILIHDDSGQRVVSGSEPSLFFRSI